MKQAAVSWLQHNRDANQPTNMGMQPAAAPAMPPPMPEAPPSRIIRCAMSMVQPQQVDGYVFASL